MDTTQGEGMVENVREQFADAAKGAMAEEGEAKDELAKPGLGDGQPEEQLRWITRRWGEGVVQSVLGGVELLVNELAADVLVLGDLGDGDASKGVEATC